jgi:hypothetical protein
VALNGLTVKDNNGDFGTKINNSDTITATGTTPAGVSINNSSFSGNVHGEGVWVVSKGAIGFINSSTDNNGNYVDNSDPENIIYTRLEGAILDNSGAAAAQSVTVTNAYFGNSGENGLSVLSKGNVIFSSLYAGNNGLNGVLVDNTFGTNATVTLSGTNNHIWGNGADGLHISSHGNISVANIFSENNGFSGLAFWTSPTATTTVTNADLVYNGYQGIAADGGTMTLSGISSYNNGAADPSGSNGAALYSHSHDITINNSNFSENAGCGIYANTGASNTLNLNNTGFFGNSTGIGVSKVDLYTDGHLKINGASMY